MRHSSCLSCPDCMSLLGTSVFQLDEANRTVAAFEDAGAKFGDQFPLHGLRVCE